VKWRRYNCETWGVQGALLEILGFTAVSSSFLLAHTLLYRHLFAFTVFDTHSPCKLRPALRLISVMTTLQNNQQPQILCIGAILWDVIGRTERHMRVGSDVPGRILRLPGGVAMNIAMTFTRFSLKPVLLGAIGQDDAGNELIRAAHSMGMITDHLYRSEDLPTDVYMAIEGANGLIAAIADAHSLEAAGAKILRPLEDGALGSDETPYEGTVALDGNLTLALLEDISNSPLFSKADLRVAPASPGKAERLLPLMDHPSATLYVNLEEAGLLLKQEFDTATDAALALTQRGAARAMVSDGGRPAAFASGDNVISEAPPEVMVTRVTGAGDTFMAAHIAAELRGDGNIEALHTALIAAANYVSGNSPQ